MTTRPRKATLGTLVLSGAIAASAAAAVAVGGAPTSEMRSSTPAPAAAPRPSAAEQRRLDRRATAQRRATRRRARASRAAIAENFALFRRPARSHDVAPNARPGEISRQARMAAAPAALGEQGGAVYLFRRSDQLCVDASGGVACGFVEGSSGPTLALTKPDGSTEALWGAAGDDVTSVQVVSRDGAKQVVTPVNNVYEVDLSGGVLRRIRFSYADGSVSTVVDVEG
jgi:hypothetical protein